jgi:phospholipase D-like protein
VKILDAVESARQQFRDLPGVLHVRPGWKIAEGRITDRQAIVALAERAVNARLHRGLPDLPLIYLGFPVDVREASPEELYDLGRLADNGLEQRITDPTYKKPPNLSLPRMQERMKVRLHVSPEWGWPTLKQFLEATGERLTVGMYDFGAPHIIDTISAVMAGPQHAMRLVIQFGASIGDGTKANDKDDAETVRLLQAALGADFEMQWASVAQRGALWASAYHIKVAVRDGAAVWLSSGNWQSSNQPAAGPWVDDTDAGRARLRDYNREWHVVVENARLAGILESYVDYDFEQSRGFVPTGLADAFEILPPLGLEAQAAAAGIRAFAPLDIDRIVDVQPVLTPDNYLEQVLPFIQSARTRLYLQNQYIHESLDERAASTYVALVQAVARKQSEGLDVRIMLRGDYAVEARHLEFMKTFGIDLARVRWRNRNHTKGIVVDSAAVLVGSHNWSFDGTVLNRDASLIFFDEEIARYFEDVFFYDWENWSRDAVQIREKNPVIEMISTGRDLAALRERVATGRLRVRRLFHPDD